MSSKTENGPPVATALTPTAMRARGFAAGLFRAAVLRLLVALASRFARLLRCPRWAVRLTFWLESKNAKGRRFVLFESARQYFDRLLKATEQETQELAQQHVEQPTTETA